MSLVCVQYNVRDAADLAIAGTAQTKWVPAKGAVQVVFRWRSTASAAPVSETVEWQNGTPVVTGGNGGSAGSGNLASTTASVQLNVVGGLKTVVTPLSGRYIGVEAVRGVIVGHATIALTLLECMAEVWYDDPGLAPVAGQAI